jgi:RNA polymerase sigma factor (sigma-70 family)
MMRKSATAQPKDREDSALAVALEAGDRERAMELLVELHGEQVYGYCRRMLGNDVDGDDVSQTVFVQAFQGLKRFDQVQHIKAWLLGIARHRCLDRLTSVRRGPQLLDDTDLAAIADGQAVVSMAETDPRVRRALDECLDQLDARSRALLVLRFHDELSYDEISALTADTSGALRVRLARALPALRQCLESKGVAP